MKKYKICVYAISKNEEQFVDRWMDAVSEADLVVVTDTGSTDNTVEKLRARGAIVFTETISPWRFDVARNLAIDHIPEDVDVCVSNDLDEVFESGWRDILEASWQPFNTRAGYRFTCTYHRDGTPDKQHVMEKIHCRNGFRWVHPVHEVLQYNGELQDNTVWIHELVLNHYPDLSKPRTEYLPLLELSVEENPDDDRALFWLGREYMYYQKYGQCIQSLQKHLQMPSATWNEERSASMRFIAKCYQINGDFRESSNWLYKAIAECPGVRESYLQMARLGYIQNDWPLVYLMVTEGLKITVKSGSYLLELDAWGNIFYDLGAICCFQLGIYQKAYDFAKMAYEMDFSDARLKQNLELCKLKLIENFEVVP